MPVAINLSFGNTYGSHDGKSLLERYIDDLSNFWKSVICVGTGNEAASAGICPGDAGKEEERIQLAVQSEEPTLNIQIWKAYTERSGNFICISCGDADRSNTICSRFAEIPDRGNGDFIILWKTEPV